MGLSLGAVVGIATGIFATAYLVFGRYLHARFDLDDARETPAHDTDDGEFVPAPKLVLFGHHFSSIAGAAVIIGPITAALAWGWLPALLWIVLGTVILGGLNDFATLVGSIRHEGHSIGQIFNRYASRRGKRLLLVVALAANLLVVGVLSLVTAVIFDAFPSAGTASVIYIALALLFGVYWYKFRLPFSVGSVIFAAATFGSVLVGLAYPLVLVPEGAAVPLPTIVNPNVSAWLVVILIYALLASVLPVWTLLQPRDYLSSFLLYGGVFGILAAIVVGTLFGTATQPLEMTLPAYTGFQSDVGPLVPLLFTTIFCGAVCGLHSMVCCGTTPKQLNQETDATLIGYGTTLMEGLLAVIAIGAVAVAPSIPSGAGLQLALPTFTSGGGVILSAIGLDPAIGAPFLALMLSAFALTTVDTAIRLGRYFIEELLEEFPAAEASPASKPILTGGVQTVLAYLMVATGSWTTVWPLFGGAVQVFAGLTMFTLAIWLINHTSFDHRLMFAGAVFTLGISLSGLVYIAGVNVTETFLDGAWLATATPIGAASVLAQLLVVVVLATISVLVVLEGIGRYSDRSFSAAITQDD
jgi:carbon starvation protein